MVFVRVLNNVGFEELTVRSLDENSFIFLPVLLKSMTTILSVHESCVSSFVLLYLVWCLLGCEPSKVTLVASMWTFSGRSDAPLRGSERASKVGWDT